MEIRKITAKLIEALEDHKCKSRFVSSEHIPKLRKTICDNLTSGVINSDVYKQYADNFNEMFTQDTTWVRSIISVAYPRPVLEMTFTINARPYKAAVPPTYEHSEDQVITEILEKLLQPHNYKVERAALPQKLLAVHSGLARYGKNNITYVDGMGSYHRLIAFYTGLPAIHDSWQNLQVLDECSNCKACINKCPTGAIDPENFQLRADKCLTFHNEASGPFPQWVDKSWHHCLIGCLKCQYYCPVNKDCKSWTERYAEFSEEETAMILESTAIDKLPSGLISKFNHTNLLADPELLSRNLKGIIASNS